MKLFYKPAPIYLLVDLLMLTLWICIILAWFPLTTNVPFDKYSIPSLYYIFSWGIWSYIVGRYQPLRKQNHLYATVKLFNVSLIVLFIFHIIILLYFFNQYSPNVLYLITAGEFALSFIMLSAYFSFRYAVEYNETITILVNNKVAKISKTGNPLDQKSLQEAYETIKDHAGEYGLDFIRKNIKFENGFTFVYSSTDIDVLKHLPEYQYSTIIQLERLNHIKGINKMLATTNEILTEDGMLICCFESKSTYKKRHLKKRSKGFRHIVYSFDFLIKRVMPKLQVSRWFYYVFSGCKNRVLSKAEVLGRLYCCGFKVEHEKKINGLNYVFARRIKTPEFVERRTYGPLIRLKRFGKDGKPFEVYKMRTMHPYSEFLQAYIYERNSLQDGGKFNKDIRVTTLGKYMRKYWLDELPMILNLLKGEMKLVGVRPLSAQYFSLYDKELQEKRIQFKPGLLPPFYADMPKTLDEIQASEMKYLTMCERQSEFATDMHYLLLIMKNIFLKKARSA